MLSRRTLVVSAAAGLAACARSAAPLNLDDVLARHTEARGGAAALDAVRTLRNVVEIAEANFTVGGRYIASVQGLMRVDIFAGEDNVFSEGLDRAGAWRWQPGGEPQPASAQGEAALRHGVEFNLFGLHRFAERGHALMLEAPEEINGVAHHVIRARLSDGFETYRFVDPSTWMITHSRDIRAFHPDVDATQTALESVFSEFQAVDGVQNPFAWIQRDLGSDEIIQRGRVLSLEHNAELTDADFDRARRA